ncbi:MAG: hypothetical protein DMG27_11785, partial [Acidobacteria bacterium]
HTYLQILAGNGDGTFTPTFTPFDFNQYLYPQFAADLNGDGKADLLELAGYSSSFHVVPAETGPALQVSLLSLPVVGSRGSARVALAVTSATDTTIQLAASDPIISLPASITIPANSLSQDVQFQIGSGFSPNRVFTIQASLGTQTATAYGWEAGGLQVGFRMTLGYASTQTILAGQTTSDYSLAISSINGYSTNLQLSCSGLPSWATCQFGQAAPQLLAGETLTPSLVVNTASAGVAGTYPFAVVATDGTVTDQVKATFSVGDFGVSLTPSTLSVLATGSASFNLSVTSANNYAGYVAMSIVGLPAGATSSLSDTGAGFSGPLVISTNNAAVGTYPFTVTGVSSGITRSATATLQVGDFGMSITPSVQAATSTGSATYTIAATSPNGFTGTIAIGISGLPQGATVGSGGGTIQAGGPSQQLVIQTAGVAGGTYPFTLTGTSGSLTHRATATLQVQGPPDFSGTISPTSASLSVGQSSKFTVALKSQNGATGSVSFQCLNVPSGTSCAFDPASVSLPADGSASDQLTVQVNSRPAAFPPGAPVPWSVPSDGLGTLCLFAAMLIAGLARQTEMKRWERRLGASMAIVIGVALLFLATSCGGGAGSPNPPPSPVTFTITVQASGAGVSTTKTLGRLTISVN